MIVGSVDDYYLSQDKKTTDLNGTWKIIHALEHGILMLFLDRGVLRKIRDYNEGRIEIPDLPDLTDASIDKRCVRDLAAFEIKYLNQAAAQ